MTFSAAFRSSPRTAILLFTLALLHAGSAGADCSPVHPGRAPNPHGNVFQIVPESWGAAADAEAIAAGVGMWQRACRHAAFRPDGNIRIRIRFHDGANDLEGCGAGCGCTIVNTLSTADGGKYVSSAIIHLFQHYRNGGGDCRSHRAESIAHDIGHALGLRDLEDPYAPSCSGRIMSYTGLRSVESEDCRPLEEVWRVPLPARGDGAFGAGRVAGGKPGGFFRLPASAPAPG